jgi:hypothetical protein
MYKVLDQPFQKVEEKVEKFWINLFKRLKSFGSTFSKG